LEDDADFGFAVYEGVHFLDVVRVQGHDGILCGDLSFQLISGGTVGESE
jgi:hypothetical protein